MVQLYKQVIGNNKIITGFGRPFSIRADGDRAILVSDMDLNCIFKIDLISEQFCWNSGVNGWSNPLSINAGEVGAAKKKPKAVFNGPHSILALKAEMYFILCYYSNSIYLLEGENEARLVTNSNMLGPSSMCFTPDGGIAVTDYGNHSISLFSTEFQFLGQLGLSDKYKFSYFTEIFEKISASSKLGGFDRPHMVGFLSDGKLVVADTWNDRVLIYETGLTNIKNTKNRELDKKISSVTIPKPVSICVDNKDNILISSWERSELFLIDNKHKAHRLSVYGELKKPYDAIFYKDGILIADSHNSRIIFSAYY